MSWQLRTKFEPRDLWVGVYWNRVDEDWLDIYVCPLPTLVVHLRRVP